MTKRHILLALFAALLASLSVSLIVASLFAPARGAAIGAVLQPLFWALATVAFLIPPWRGRPAAVFAACATGFVIALAGVILL